MSYFNPHAKVTKICPVCGKQFETIAYYNQVYDSGICYRKAKHQRRNNRDQPTVPTKLEEKREQLLEAECYFSTVHSPTIEQLDNFVKVISLNLNDNKPIKITGSIPQWTPPKGIALVEQQGVESRMWLLVAREVSPLDELLNR